MGSFCSSIQRWGCRGQLLLLVGANGRKDGGPTTECLNATQEAFLPDNEVPMTQLEFLNRVLPELPPAGSFGRPECLFALMMNGGPMIQRPCSSPSDVADICNEYSAAGYDTYMALAGFNSPVGGRKQDNAFACRAFWADIDAGKPNSVYRDWKEALAAVVSFAQNTGIEPTIINCSGAGLHVYWTMSRNVAARPWVAVATMFQQLCKQENLDVDPARAHDLASVLRVPGTLHRKSGNRVTTIWASEKNYDPQEFTLAVHSKLQVQQGCPTAPAIGASLTPAPIAVPVPLSTDDAFGFGASPKVADAASIVYGCPQLMTMGLSSYHQWFNGMSVLRRCENGLEWAHKLSAMDTRRYDPANTERRYFQAAEDAPTRCSTFEQGNPQLCAQCRFRGRVKTPVQLSRINHMTPPQPPVQSAGCDELDILLGHQAHLVIPEKFDYPRININHPSYSVDHRGMVWRRAVKDASGAYNTEESIICETQLYYKHGIYEFTDGRPHRYHIFDAVHPNGKVEELRLSIDEDMSATGIMRWLYNANMYPTNGKAFKGELFLDFINAYLQAVTQNNKELATFDNLGWQNFTDPVTKQEHEGFVVGRGVITDTGIHDARLGNAASFFAKRELGTHGTLDQWKFAADMYKTLNQPVGQLAICLSLAAPLMRYGTGEARSAIFSLWSDLSGLGKTQVLRAAASVWGDPDAQFISREASSVARQRKMSVLNNLPVYMDEMTDVSDEDMYGLAYTLVGGKEKDKLRSSGDSNINTGNWSTVSFMTANRAFKAAISRRAGDSDATLLRVMEYECDFPSYEHVPQVNDYIHHCIRTFKANYGIAGPEFVFQFMQKPDRLAVLSRQVEHWVHKNGFKNNERFMSNPLALAMFAGRWAVEFGILNYDMDALERWVLSEFVNHNRKNTMLWTPDFTNILSTYLMERQLHTLVVKDDDRTAKEPDPGMKGLPDKYVLSFPTREPLVRASIGSNTVMFSRADFSQWCKKRRLTVPTLIKRLAADGVKLTEVTRNFGKDISYLSLPRMRAWAIDPKSLHRLGYQFEYDDKPKEGD